MTKFIKTSKNYALELFQRYKMAQGGVAAIEFVFVAPVMISMYFGLAEISTAISQDRQISHSANVAGDLTTQVATVDSSEMSEIMTAAVTIMGIPKDKIPDITMEIASYSRDASGNAVSRGKATFNGPYPETFNAATLDDLILSQSSGVVVARVSYDYEPLKLEFMTTNFTMSETFLLKPRKSANVDFQKQLTTAGPTIGDFTCNYVLGIVNCT